MSCEIKGRLLGGTEVNWCKAVSCGTGISVLALQVSKEPDITLLQSALHKLQNAHPILKSMLHKTNSSTSTFSFVIPPTPPLRITSYDRSATSDLLKTLSNPSNASLSPFRLILEHELNINPWTTASNPSARSPHVFFASLYAVPGEKWVLALRLHTAVCDPTTAVSLLKELMELVVKREGSEGGIEKKEEVSLGIEDLVPVENAKKSLWAHGLDVLGYSINSLRLTNLKFKDVTRPRRTEVVRLLMNKQETDTILAGCKTRGIKLCGALTAAVLIAANRSKQGLHHHHKKYGVVTFTDCRLNLQPPLSGHNFGFYHSAILNIHAVKGGENLWDVARRTYTAFANSKKSNKHFSDMADLNFLMSKAIDNPSLTASSSLRTSLVSVFEDPIFDNSNEMQREIGLDDYIGCSSTHGVGPSIAIFDTIHDGKLDCACVYPSPLHSREQIQELVDSMKMILADA